MSGTEKAHLCRLIVFEAAKRQVEELEGKQLELRRFHLIVLTCEMIERGEMKNCDMSCLFTLASTLSVENLKKGYANHASFLWLREQGSIEAHFEAQTFLAGW